MYNNNKYLPNTSIKMIVFLKYLYLESLHGEIIVVYGLRGKNCAKQDFDEHRRLSILFCKQCVLK